MDGEEELKKRFNTESARKKEREPGRCKTPGTVPGNCEVSHCLVQDAPGTVWHGIVPGILWNGTVNFFLGLVKLATV